MLCRVLEAAKLSENDEIRFDYALTKEKVEEEKGFKLVSAAEGNWKMEVVCIHNLHNCQVE